MNSKFSKKLEISFRVNNIIIEGGEDISDTISDSQLENIMEAAALETLNRSIEYLSGEIIFNISVDDVDYEVYVWFDKKYID